MCGLLRQGTIYLAYIFEHLSFLIELNAISRFFHEAKLMINVFRALGIVMVPLTMNFPTSVFCYWVTNNTFSL